MFDPHIQLEAIYGTNRNFILNQIPHIARLLSANLQQTLDWADHLVLAQKPNASILSDIQSSQLPVIDLVGAGLSRVANSAAPANRG